MDNGQERAAAEGERHCDEYKTENVDVISDRMSQEVCVSKCQEQYEDVDRKPEDRDVDRLRRERANLCGICIISSYEALHLYRRLRDGVEWEEKEG